jgi:hypothetical protein
VIASAGASSAQGYRVGGPDERGGSTASVRPSGEGAATTTPATGQESTATITNRGVGGPGAATVSNRRERAWWEYAGVTPGSTEYAVLRRWARRRSRDGRVVVAWPGFQMTQGGSRLFLAVSAVPRMTPVNEPGRLVYRLERASVPLRNNRRVLETAAFETPVARAYLRPRRGSVDLVIELRASGVQPTQTQQPGPDGITFIMLDFGRWTAPAQTSATTTGAVAPRTATARGGSASREPEPQGVRLSESERAPTNGANNTTTGSENPDVRANGRDDERPAPPVVR